MSEVSERRLLTTNSIIVVSNSLLRFNLEIFYRAKWISAAFQTIFLQDFVDVTLACADGSTIAAHKVILSSVSTYFRDILKVSLPSWDKTLSWNSYYLQIKRTVVVHSTFIWCNQSGVTYLIIHVSRMLRVSIQSSSSRTLLGRRHKPCWSSRTLAR